MKIFSSAFKDGEWIPKKYSARGEDISPELQITELPEGTVSLVVMLDDSSHPLFPNYNHWVVWNIPPCKEIPEGIEKGKFRKGSSNGKVSESSKRIGFQCGQQLFKKFFK